MAHSRAPVLEHGARLPGRTPADSQNRSEGASLRRKPAVADRIDAPVHPVQASSEHPCPHRILAHSSSSQLNDGDRAVLPLGDSGD